MINPRVPLLSPEGEGRLHMATWLGCVAVYVLVLVSGLMAGGSDFVSLGKAMGATMALALLGRMAMSILKQATREVVIPNQAPEHLASLGSLVDVVSNADEDEEASPYGEDEVAEAAEYELMRSA